MTEKITLAIYGAEPAQPLAFIETKSVYNFLYKRTKKDDAFLDKIFKKHPELKLLFINVQHERIEKTNKNQKWFDYVKFKGVYEIKHVNKRNISQ